ncbi:Hsp20/alpha crystallin family protein [Plantactinospora sp. GCM10030261]|uniref:Hsp20/alpha crystallin family protein n=1 Tax=Plantactinospora sp. GCM10030261 TaxID=3273420 RepID=UPI00361639F7
MSHPRRSDRGWDPFAELQALRGELGRLVGTALVGAGGGTPDVDLTESAEGWTVTARLPGVAPDEVALELDDRELCIRGRSEAEVNADLGMPGTGSRSRTFEHRVTLPNHIDADRIDAVMDHGLLTVRLPRAARSARRTITIGRTVPGAAGAAGGVSVGVGPASPSLAGDPAADRELHRPDVVDTTLRQPG